MEFAFFLIVSVAFSVYKQALRLNNSKTRIAINVKISVFAICVEAIMYLLLYNLHDCTFKMIFHHVTAIFTFFNHLYYQLNWKLHFCLSMF